MNKIEKNLHEAIACRIDVMEICDMTNNGYRGGNYGVCKKRKENGVMPGVRR